MLGFFPRQNVAVLRTDSALQGTSDDAGHLSLPSHRLSLLTPPYALNTHPQKKTKTINPPTPPSPTKPPKPETLDPSRKPLAHTEADACISTGGPRGSPGRRPKPGRRGERTREGFLSGFLRGFVRRVKRGLPASGLPWDGGGCKESRALSSSPSGKDQEHLLFSEEDFK